MATETQNADISEIVIQAGNKHDPEPSKSEKRKLTRSNRLKIVDPFQLFVELFYRIHSRPKRRVLYEESDVYHRLMDDLEDEEDPPCWYMKLYVALEIVVILGLTAALVVTLKVERIRRQKSFLTLPAWQWVVLVMVLVSGVPVVRFITFLVFAPVKWWWRTHKYVVYFVKEIKRCVDVTLWFGLVLVAWYLWFRPRLRDVKGEVSIIVAHQTTRLLIALVLGSFLWLLKNLLHLKLKADLHYDQLFDRIQRTVLDFHGIMIIYKDGMWNFLTSDKIKKKVAMAMAAEKMKEKQSQEKQSEAKEGEEKNENENENEKGKEGHVKMKMKGKNIWMDVSKMKNETIPIWITRRLAQTYLKHMKTGLPNNRDATKDDQKLMTEAQQMLKKVIRDEDQQRIRSDIMPDDLQKYQLNQDEQKCLFKIFHKVEEKEDNKEEQQRITRDQFLSWAVVAYKNCWGLERTLRSSERVFIKLNRILSTFLLTVVLIIWLLLSTIVDTGQLALLFTPFLAASFIFGDTCKKMFEGLIFAFAMHPFDVGDRVVVDNVQMKVSQLNILTSVFFKYDTGEEVVYPNSLLASTKITNLDIIPDQADCLEFTIPPSIPLEDITDLELKIKKALDDDLTYSSQTKVVKKEIGKEEIKMAVYFKYLVSYLAAETKAMHRSNILTKIMEFAKEMDSNIKRLSNMGDPQVLPVEFTLDPKVTLRQINDLKGKILEANKEHYIKLVVKDLDKKRIKMVLYLREPKCSSGDSMDKEKQQVHAKIQTFKDQLKIHQSTGAWPSLRLSEIRSLGRTNENEGAPEEVITSKHQQGKIPSTSK